jgi:hypothetical protein
VEPICPTLEDVPGAVEGEREYASMSTDPPDSTRAVTKLSTPQATRLDTVLACMRAAVSAIPYAGSPAVELMSLLITPPIEKRRNEWMEEVADRICQLQEEKKLRVEDLPSNNAFIDTVFHATQAAVRTSSEGKRTALRNAVLNSALPNAPDETKRQMFVRLVDDFTEWHLRILDLLHDPVAWFRARNRAVPEFTFTGSLERLLQEAYAEAKDQADLLDLIAKDLHLRGLLGTAGLRGLMSARGTTERHSTELGGEFLGFIRGPCSDDSHL